MNDLKQILDVLIDEDSKAKNMGEICLIARLRGFVNGLQDQYNEGEVKQFVGENI